MFKSCRIMQDQKTNLVLSTDVKPRLKWTLELHERFVAAVNQLGGPEKATPKSLMKIMGIPGLTLYHLKSHLQKYRIGKSQQSDATTDGKPEDYKEIQSRNAHFTEDITDGTQSQINESFQIGQALQLQIEVQRKLHEQIEVQRRLQLRIEAQGKYLQSILNKAQQTLSRSTSSGGIETAKAEISQLVSMVNNQYPSSSLSELTEIGGFSFKDLKKNQMTGTICSMESSLMSSESSGREDAELPMNQNGNPQKSSTTFVELPCRKRSGSTVSDGNCLDLLSNKRFSTEKEKTDNKIRKLGMSEMIDLNRTMSSE